MSLNNALAFLLFNLAILSSVTLGFYIKSYIERKRKEKRELAEAARMFEERIALKPKHMSGRHSSGAAPMIFGEVDSDDNRAN
jgi:hypothetical protein